MKTISKMLTILLAVGLLLSATSCADVTWSYKDTKNTVSIGTYIYYMSGAYGYAQNQLTTKAQEKADPSKPTEPTDPYDLFNQKIEDKNGDKVNAREFIIKEAEKACKNLLSVNKTFDDLGLKLTDTQIEAAQKNTNDAWMYYGKNYEKLGIAKESFYQAEYLFAAKYEEIFKATYEKGGSKEVAEDDIMDFYLDEYTSYSYYPVNLYESKPSEDGQTSVSSALKDDEIKKIKDDLNKGAKEINSGDKTFEEFTKEYNKANKITTDPTVTNAEVLADSSIGEEIKKAIEKLENNEASTITVGKDSSAVMYVVYKGDIKDTVKDDFAKTTSYSVLQKMKAEEFGDDMQKLAENYKCEKNEAAINKYQPEMLVTTTK